MLKRLPTTIIGLPLVIIIVNHGGWLLFLACTLLSLVGLRELYFAFAKEDKLIHLVGYVFTIGYFVTAFVFGTERWIIVVLTLFIITVHVCLVVFFGRLPLKDIVVTVYGFFYIPFLLSFILLVREHAVGQYYVWLIFISAFGCDTFAYLTGVTIGRRKLVNSPSPVKSVEGIIGGIIGAAVVGLLYGYFVTRFLDPGSVDFIVINAVVISVFGAVFCIIGDMAASAIKRHNKIKDFGNVFPGHGGVIDRVDSVIVVAPIVYLVMNILILLQ